MEQKNAVVLARELAKKEDWVNIYKICKEYLDREEDDDSWAVLGPQEHEELALLKIECVIKTIVLQDLFSGKYDDGYMLWNDDYDDIVDILFNAIRDLGHIILTGDENESTKKIEQFYSKVSLMAKEHYFFMLNETIKNISADSRDETHKKYINYMQSYGCLCQIIMRSFFTIADALDIDNLIFDQTYYQEAITYQNARLFDRAVDITNMISQSSNDFPYYDSVDVVYMYISAIGIVAASLAVTENDLAAQNVKITRLKHKIDLICDCLNAILVLQGERVSLLMDESTREEYFADMLECEKEVRKVEKNYSHPPVNKEKISTIPDNKSGGCYVATAIYGSYDCPEVWTLRRYRDYTLAKTWYGRAFIYTYYAISPTLVKWFGHTEWFKKMWQGKLECMVAKLQEKGFDSTPYEDKKWK